MSHLFNKKTHTKIVCVFLLNYSFVYNCLDDMYTKLKKCKAK